MFAHKKMNYFLDKIRNSKKLKYLIINLIKMKLFLNKLFVIFKIIILIWNYNNNLKKKEKIFLEKNINNKQVLV
jgi:hypothetical protein